MKLDKKLDHFYQSVVEDATQQSDSVLTEYKESLVKQFNEGKASLEQKAEVTLKIETDSLIRKKNKALSSQAIEIKRIINDKNNELKDRLFSGIEQKINDFMQTEAYFELLKAQITSAKNFAREEHITIYINSSDADKKTELESLTGAQLTVSTSDFMGGTRAVIHDKHILIDNSFTTKLAEEKDSFQF